MLWLLNGVPPHHPAAATATFSFGKIYKKSSKSTHSRPSRRPGCVDVVDCLLIFPCVAVYVLDIFLDICMHICIYVLGQNRATHKLGLADCRRKKAKKMLYYVMLTL